MEQNSLIRKEDNLSPQLSISERAIVLYSRELKIKDCQTVNIANSVSEAIAKAIVSLNGFKIDSKERQLMEGQIVNDLKSGFNNLTLSEFQNAVYMGSKGLLKNRPEDIVFLSATNIHQWITKYKSEVKTDAMKKQIQFESKQNTVDVDAKKKESEQIVINDLIAEFDNFLNKKPIYDPINILYDFMDKRGMVHISNERKIEIFKECKDKFTTENKNSNSIADHVIKRKILQEIENGSDRVKSIIKMKAKNKALIEVFQDIHDSGMSMDSYLEFNGIEM